MKENLYGLTPTKYRAFLAKYGCEPDEVEQVEQMTDTGRVWFLRKRLGLFPKERGEG